MKDNIKLMRQAGREGVQTAAVLPYLAAARVSALSERMKVLLVAALATFGVFAYSGGVAWAAKKCGGAGAADRLSDFIGQAALFLIAIGGASALLMFAVGALFIIFSTSSEKKKKGMDILKNAVIGLVVLGVGIFVKYVVLAFIKGATGNNNSVGNCIEYGNKQIGGGG